LDKHFLPVALLIDIKKVKEVAYIANINPKPPKSFCLKSPSAIEVENLIKHKQSFFRHLFFRLFH